MTTHHHETPDIIRVPFNELKLTLEDILLRHQLPADQAAICAEVFATNSLEGVHSHGVNRFPKFLEYVTAGHVRAGSYAVKTQGTHAVEQWDGRSGPGPVNAFIAVDRAMELAREYGIGCVALANTNHWLRGGTYAWKAACAGFAYIAWSNTIANMPPWGAVDPKLGNNPLILATPAPPKRGDEIPVDEAIVLDMAMSLYSFGAMEIRAQKREQLPYPGGYDRNGNLTTDPLAIIESSRPLPIGYWKGAGLSLLLDILAAVLSGGLSTADLTAQGAERNLSQVFIAIDLTQLHNYSAIGKSIRTAIEDYLSATPAGERDRIRYPGENIIKTRKENLKNGVPVWKKTWEAVVG